ncbi:hypothetical protein EGW08_005442 [Elysia chlorotica]|uniref:Metalloendopeptidase n=1 Tax=Elysia chlorotica TaxID=188477 RepID=A0A433TYZ9_ELYCH|nr:hypothetical protein EGW08_005442 [Elysia chlorotica]
MRAMLSLLSVALVTLFLQASCQDATGGDGLLRVSFTEHESYGDPEVTPGYFEGDIELPKFRNAIRSSLLKWPQGRVPYQIHSLYSSEARSNILAAMREIESDTKHDSTYCVRFEPKTSADVNYIYVVPQDGCHSPVGRHAGRSLVSIGQGCENKGTVMHELLHSLGFYHEQNRYDRDSYVDIHYSNVPADRQDDFAKLTIQQTSTLNTPYDYGSIMHYSAYIFAIDGSSPTITPKPNLANGRTLGQRLKLSTNDVKRVQILYGCTVDTSHIIEPANTQLLIDCTFESGWCGLVQDSSDDFQWSRRIGSTPTSGTGPNGDHTNGIGHYIYAESNGHYNKYARIKSGLLPAGRYCIHFYLFDYGSQVGQFSVNIEGPRLVPQVVKRWSGSQKKAWINVGITLTSPAEWKLVLESHVGAGTHSDVALDDLQVYAGSCVF